MSQGMASGRPAAEHASHRIDHAQDIVAMHLEEIRNAWNQHFDSLSHQHISKRTLALA
jgi:hypothetical protein